MLLLPVFLVLLAACHCKVEFGDRARNFSVELLYFTAEETNWHTVISPLGVWSLLTGIFIGATGNSRQQLRRSLFLPNKTSAVISGHKNLMTSVIRTPTEEVALKTYNYLFADSGFAIGDTFQRTIVDDFDAKVIRLEFQKPREAAIDANTIIQRSGVSVSNVIRSDDFVNSRMILINVISFKGTWTSPFNASLTHVEPFHDEDKNVIGKVNMMLQQGIFAYSNVEKISAFVLEMPYGEQRDYSFLAVLPYEGRKVADVYAALETVSLKELFGKLERDIEKYGEADVVVSLPRFKISTNVVLNRPLGSMGVVDIFDSQKASFGLISAERLHVSAVVHKAEIEVTETGTVASAASSAYFSDRSLPANFHANRPFLYFVVDKRTTTIIFGGVYSKPTIF